MPEIDLKKEFEWQRHLLYQILITQERQMADLSKLTASIAKLNADVDTLLNQPDSTSQADVDALQASVDAEDAKVIAKLPAPPTA